MKFTKNWRIRYADPNDKESFFFIEGDLGKDGHYPRVEVMQEDYGDHNGYDYETRLADANLIVSAPKLLESLSRFSMLNKEKYPEMAGWIEDAEHIVKKATQG